MVLHSKFHRTVAHEFSIELHRHLLIAANAQALSLEVLHLRQPDVRAEKYILQIFDDLEVAHLLERNYIQQPVIEQRVFEKWKRTAVASSVSDQNKGCFFE